MLNTQKNSMDSCYEAFEGDEGGTVIPIGQVYDRVQANGVKACTEWIKGAMQMNSLPLPTHGTIEKSLGNVISKVKNLRKSVKRPDGKENLGRYLKEAYVFPKARGPQQSDAVFSMCLPAVLHNANAMVNHFQSMTYSMAEELNEQTSYSKEVEENLKKVQKECKEQRGLSDKLKVKTTRLETSLKRKSTELKATVSRENYQRDKVAKLEQKGNNQAAEEYYSQVAYLEDELEEKSVEIKTLKEENDTLRAEIEEHENPNVQLFDRDSNTFTPEAQSCVYKLLEHHVSSQHIGPVISTVLKLAGLSPDRVPSVSTVHNMNLQRLSLAQKQISNLLPEKANLCLLTDETSKYGNKTGGYHVRDEEGQYFVLGLRDLVTKSGQDTLDTFKIILEDINTRSKEAQSDKSKQILINIVSTMSDSAATEKKFNRLLEEYRSSVLPYTCANMEALSEAERSSTERLMNFFCVLHSLVHMAEISASTLLEAEKSVEVEPNHHAFVNQSEPGTVRLIKSACKAFARGADEKSGCHGPFLTYVDAFLKANQFKTLPLVPFRGSRFNILFLDGGLVYFLHEQMAQFLQLHELNKLTKSVQQDLNVPMYVAGCKALGLISKLITTPLWNIAEDNSISILDTSKYLLQLKTGLVDVAAHIEEFMAGKLRPFGDDVPINEDKVFTCLITPSIHDNDVATILSITIPALTKYVSNKFQDLLPGGQHSTVTPDLVKKTQSVPKHNKFSERVFAYTDQLLRFKPSIKTLTAEAYTMFCLNKTADWLETKSEQEQNQLMAEARKDVKDLRKEYAERRKELEMKRWEHQQAQRKKKEEQLNKKVREREALTQEIVAKGLWKTSEEVDRKLESLKTKAKKLEALKNQLKFRKDVLLQKSDVDGIFKFSKKINGKQIQHDVNELASNLKVLLNSTPQPSPEPTTPQNIV